MKIKTSELEGAALDWAVALTQGWQPDPNRPASEGQMIRQGKDDRSGVELVENLPYSADWSHGGPLIDQLISNLVDVFGDWYAEASEGMYGRPLDEFDGKGPTALIAAMRAIVASEIGDEVDVPDELLEVVR